MRLPAFPLLLIPYITGFIIYPYELIQYNLNVDRFNISIKSTLDIVALSVSLNEIRKILLEKLKLFVLICRNFHTASTLFPILHSNHTKILLQTV